MNNEKERFYRANGLIKFSPVIVIDQNGKNLGSVALHSARSLAEQAGLDLVEISPNSRPPVCRIMDFGKFKFDQNLKEKKQRRKQKQFQLKEIRLSPSIQEHDLETKARSAIKFLEAGHKVSIKLEFKRRELAHRDIGFSVIDGFVNRIKDHGSSASKPKSEGRSLLCVVEPLQSKPQLKGQE